MGIRNRDRRKAKQKTREHRRERAGTVRPEAAAEIVAALVHGAVVAVHGNDVAEFERCVGLLSQGPGGTEGQRLVDRAILARLCHDIGHVWTGGWQPADLVRVVGRRCTARHVRLAVDLIAAQMRSYATATVDERWEAQLRALGCHVWWTHDDRYVEQWGERERLDRGDVLRCAIEVLYLVDTLPGVAVLCPPPGTARRGALRADVPGPRVGEGPGMADGGHRADQRMLDRVRALLAKAESTEFPEEAEAYTAKAQELMARYSIDEALLAARQGGRDRPCGVRIGVDNPYEAAKALLLQKVAEANRCRSVWSRELGFGTVLGFPADLDAVELMYTSLLVQATAAMVAEGSRRDLLGRSRTRSFRQSFLQAYAIRIGERLQSATAEAGRQASAEAGDDRLLPVLAARDDAVRERVEELFPVFTSHRVTVNNREGWASGTAAADLASLGIRHAVDGLA